MTCTLAVFYIKGLRALSRLAAHLAARDEECTCRPLDPPGCPACRRFHRRRWGSQIPF
jgi:hypothetical protein